MFGNKKLIEENKRLKEWCEELSRPDDIKGIGILTVEIPLNLGKEQTDKVLKMVQDNMDAEMKRLDIEMDWIIMPSIVKNVQIVTLTSKKE